MEEWIKKSKTIKGGIATMLLGLFITIFGTSGGPPKTVNGLDRVYKSVDDLDKKQKDTTSKIVGLGLLGSAGLVLIGRANAQKKLKGDKK